MPPTKICLQCGLVFGYGECPNCKKSMANYVSYPFRCTKTSLCLVHVDKKQICNHVGGCYDGECEKLLEAKSKRKLNEAML